MTSFIWGVVLIVKGNLAHTSMGLYFLYFQFHLDIGNVLKTKIIRKTAISLSHRNLRKLKIKFRDPQIVDFPMTPCVTSLQWGIPSRGKWNSSVDDKYFMSLQKNKNKVYWYLCMGYLSKIFFFNNKGFREGDSLL